MKVLWIVNTLLNDLSMHLLGKGSNGVWMDALLKDFKEVGEHQLIVATATKIKERVRLEKDGVVYYALPDDYPIRYNEKKKKNQAQWARLLEEEKPDIIQVWGTEFTHGLCALEQAKNIPSVIYMQGFLGSIARYYLAGISRAELKRTHTFRDTVKRDSILAQQRRYYRSAKKEAKTLSLSGRIISENEWCNAQVKAVCPTIKTYECPLSINEVFSKTTWEIEKAERHLITCTASGYTIKGLHMVLRAAALLKKEYPDIKICVPGTPVKAGKSLKGRLRKNGYTKYLENLVQKLGVQENLVWLGNLTQEELAKQYEKTHVFAMSSSIENHSSSLKEGMMVGVPCITSAVGGIPEYVHHGENGLLYRFEEYEMLAKLIRDVFEDDDLAKRLSKNAREDMLKLHKGQALYQKITAIYEEILNERNFEND